MPFFFWRNRQEHWWNHVVHHLKLIFQIYCSFLTCWALILNMRCVQHDLTRIVPTLLWIGSVFATSVVINWTRNWCLIQHSSKGNITWDNIIYISFNWLAGAKKICLSRAVLCMNITVKTKSKLIWRNIVWLMFCVLRLKYIWALIVISVFDVFVHEKYFFSCSNARAWIIVILPFLAMVTLWVLYEIAIEV